MLYTRNYWSFEPYSLSSGVENGVCGNKQHRYFGFFLKKKELITLCIAHNEKKTLTARNAVSFHTALSSNRLALWLMKMGLVCMDSSRF
jgi:hypothetical protein